MANGMFDEFLPVAWVVDEDFAGKCSEGSPSVDVFNNCAQSPRAIQTLIAGAVTILRQT